MAHFLHSETGAVTVDWVVLTAALVGLGLATMGVVSQGVEDVSGDIEGQLQNNNIIRTSFIGVEDIDLLALLQAYCSNPGEGCNAQAYYNNFTSTSGDSDAALQGYRSQNTGYLNTFTEARDGLAGLIAAQGSENVTAADLVTLGHSSWPNETAAQNKIDQYGGIESYLNRLDDGVALFDAAVQLNEFELRERGILPPA